MTFRLDQVVPWGRRLDEYRAMFALSDTDLNLRILGCGDGPASFNAEATAAGAIVTSIDPIYEYSKLEIGARVEQVFDDMIGQVNGNAADFVWGQGIDDIDHLTSNRRSAMQLFLDDYEAGRQTGRYLLEQLPTLSFDDDSFDLALCSHLLFLYGEQFTAQFHIDSIVELCRVATEVRVFPLLENGSLPSRHLERVRTELAELGVQTEIQAVDYQFQRGGNEQLIARKNR